MGMITLTEHGEYTLTLREPSVNPCYSRRPDGSHDHGRRPHRRLRRGDALRRQGSGPRHGLARRAGRRGGRRRGHGVAPPRSRGGERARQRRRGVPAGLALPLAARLGLSAGRAALPGGRWLIVAGSLHEATRRQLARARRAGLRVLATAAAEDTDTGEAAATLAREAARLLATESFDLIVLIGGDTAVAFYRTLDAMRIDLVGAPRPGLAFGYVRAPGHPVLPVLTKAGGFGPPGLFVSLWKEAAS